MAAMEESVTEHQVRRHCMIVHAYYPLGETRVQREAETLLRHGFQVDVICLRGRDQLATDAYKGVRIYRLPVQRHKPSGLAVQLFEYLLFFLLSMLKVTWLHRRWRYNTIQIHNPPDFLVFSAWLPRLFGAKIILDLHDLMPEFYMGRFQRDATGLPVRLVCLQEYLSCCFAHHVITVSHHWREALIERSVDAEKISVVMNVADDKIFGPPSVRPRPVRTNGSLRLIYHGTVTQRYGLDLVLHALTRLREDASKVHLTILGGGDYSGNLMQLVDELDLNDQVTFHHRLRPAEELPEIILAADMGVVPYRDDPFTDGLVPTKLMEYAALGLPSIAARTTAIAHYFEDTMVEFFTPGNVDDLARCIMKFYVDRTQLVRLAQTSEDFNQRYNWRKISAEYVALVTRLAAD
jgi:glycosyltransferase involved in cell wall biosynthesis